MPTKLSNDVKTVFGAQDVFELHDVRMVESFQEVYLGKYGIF